MHSINLTSLWRISLYSHKATVNLNQHFPAPWLPSPSPARWVPWWRAMGLPGLGLPAAAAALSDRTSPQLARHSTNMWKPSFPNGILQARKRGNDAVCSNWGCGWHLQLTGEQNLTKEKGQDAPSLFCPGAYCQFVRCHRSKASLGSQLSRHTHFHPCYDMNLMTFF